jgi:hypothetical protein
VRDRRGDCDDAAGAHRAGRRRSNVDRRFRGRVGNRRRPASRADLADAVGFDWALARQNIDLARPGAAVLEVSARTGLGLDAWIDLLEARRQVTRDGQLGAQPRTNP